MINLNDKQKLESVNFVLDCLTYSKNYFRDYYKFCKALYSLRNAEIPEEIMGNFPLEFPALVPVDMYNNVQDLVASFYKILFSSDNVFRASPEGKTPEINARRATTYLAKAVALSNLKMEFTKSIIAATTYARGVGYVDAVEMELPKLSQVMAEGNWSIDFEKQKFIVPKYIPCQLRRHFPEPVTTAPNWAIQQEKVSFIDLMQELDRGEDSKYEFKPDALWNKKDSFPKGEFEEFYSMQEAKSFTVHDMGFWVELLQFRGWMPIWDDRRKAPKFIDCIATVANRSELIRFEQNELHYPAVESFIYTHLFPSDQEQIIPVGKVEASFDTFMHKFYIRNQMLMTLNRNLNPSYITDDINNANIPQYIPVESGRVYKISKSSKLEPLDQTTVPNAGFVQVDVFTDEMLNTFGNSRYTAGQDPRRKETAYGISVLKQGSQEPKEFQTEVILNYGLLKVARRYLDIGQLFLEQMPMKLFDSNEVQMIGRDQIFGEFNMTLDINQVWNENMQRQELMQSIEIFKDDPDIDQKELKMRFFRSLGFPEVEKLVPPSTVEMSFIDKENQLMVQYGVFVPVKPEENHLLHFKLHQQYISNPIVAQHAQIHQQMFQTQEKPAMSGVTPGGGRPQLPMLQNEPDLIKQISQRLEPNAGG